MVNLYFSKDDILPEHLQGMTSEQWNSLSHRQRETMRDNSHLSPQLIGLEGCRVEVVDFYGARRRFIVGKSTGWRPIHLEIKTKRSLGGDPANAHYQSINFLEKVR